MINASKNLQFKKQKNKKYRGKKPVKVDSC